MTGEHKKQTATTLGLIPQNNFHPQCRRLKLKAMTMPGSGKSLAVFGGNRIKVSRIPMVDGCSALMAR